MLGLLTMGTGQGRRDARELIGERVRVHFNLHRGDYVISQRGRVVAYAERVTLAGAEFVVSDARRRRVLASGQRSVHAYIWGTLIDCRPRDLFGATRVTYNPRRDFSFVNALTGARIDTAPTVHCAGAYAYLVDR